MPLRRSSRTPLRVPDYGGRDPAAAAAAGEGGGGTKSGGDGSISTVCEACHRLKMKWYVLLTLIGFPALIVSLTRGMTKAFNWLTMVSPFFLSPPPLFLPFPPSLPLTQQWRTSLQPVSVKEGGKGGRGGNELQARVNARRVVLLVTSCRSFYCVLGNFHALLPLPSLTYSPHPFSPSFPRDNRETGAGVWPFPASLKSPERRRDDAQRWTAERMRSRRKGGGCMKG